MNQELKDLIQEALDMKLASIKRMQNSNKNPRFNVIYEEEAARVNEAKIIITKLK